MDYRRAWWICCLLAQILPWATQAQLRGATVAVRHDYTSSQQRRILQQLSAEPYLQHVLQGYMSNAQLEEHMRIFTSRCGISRVFSIGKSVKGTDLWAMEVSNNPGVEEAKPKFKYVANMHGDEPTGRVLQLALAEWLCANWKKDPRARQIVEDMKLYLLPTMNPDGFSSKLRGNAAHIDLNRDFPDPLELGIDNLEPTGKEQPETAAIMAWSKSQHFVASASLHEGAFVANYPWDGSADKGTHYAASPDDATFIHLAKSYASLHGKMNVSNEFKDGITNGAAWYPLWGGMQDWNYLAAGCMELTLELSQNKWPPEDQLPSIWEDNRLALVNLPLTAAFGGLRGFVAAEGEGSKKPLQATITVESIAYNTTTSSKFGDYYRPLAPGKYVVNALATGYEPQSAQVVIPEDGSGSLYNFTLAPLGGQKAAAASTAHGAFEGLPRKLGTFKQEMAAAAAARKREGPLISEGLWIRMMQTSLIFFLGCSMGLLAIYALLAMRLVSVGRGSPLAAFLPLRSSAR